MEKITLEWLDDIDNWVKACEMFKVLIYLNEEQIDAETFFKDDDCDWDKTRVVIHFTENTPKESELFRLQIEGLLTAATNTDVAFRFK